MEVGNEQVGYYAGCRFRHQQTAKPQEVYVNLTSMLPKLRVCEHGFHHPYPDRIDYPHSCDGCWCDDVRDMTDYGWTHGQDPGTIGT